MYKIKFRGHDRRGNTFYGTYNEDMGVIDDWEYAATHAVDKAEQLVSVDKNGKEVHEGDMLKYFVHEYCPVANQIERYERYCEATFSYYDAINEGKLTLSEA